MKQNDNGIRERYIIFYQNWSNADNLEGRLFKYLLAEVHNDLIEKDIKTFADWLKYYSTDTNDFNKIVNLANSYYEKILGGKLDDVTFEERLLGFNSLALYALELDIEFPKDSTRLQGTIMASFIEIILNYDLVLKGYLSVKGDILIHNKKQCTFYSVWSAGNVRKEVPINLF